MQGTDNAIPDKTDKTPAIWDSHLMCYPLNGVAGQEASQGGSPSSVSSRKSMGLIRHPHHSVSALSFISCVSLSMLVRVSEPGLIPHLPTEGDRPFP